MRVICLSGLNSSSCTLPNPTHTPPSLNLPLLASISKLNLKVTTIFSLFTSELGKKRVVFSWARIRLNSGMRAKIWFFFHKRHLFEFICYRQTNTNLKRQPSRGGSESSPYARLSPAYFKFHQSHNMFVYISCVSQFMSNL